MQAEVDGYERKKFDAGSDAQSIPTRLGRWFLSKGRPTPFLLSVLMPVFTPASVVTTPDDRYVLRGSLDHSHLLLPAKMQDVGEAGAIV